MKKKKKLNEFINYLLKEDNNIPEPQSSYEVRPVEEIKNASLDQVVDRYIIRYEKESIPTTQSYENEMFENIKHFSKILTEVLKEAEDDKTDNTNNNDGLSDNNESDFGGDLTSTTEIGGNTTKKSDSSKQKPVINTPQINLQEFTKNIARLVNNFETLLNPKDIIINRVENYILTNYDQRTAEEFIELLDKNYSLRTLEKNEDNQENIPTPYAAGSLSFEG